MSITLPRVNLNSVLTSERLARLKTAGVYLPTLRRGIEKEALRSGLDGGLSQAMHPRTLGSPLTNPNITTDFSESQVELITQVHPSIADCLQELAEIQTFVSDNLKEELLWPFSMPCHIRKDHSIPIAQYGSTNLAKAKTIYRRGLSNRYGSEMQTISGIHYNFSLSDACWKELGYVDQVSRTRGYFDLIRNFRRWSWLLVYLFGASPTIPKQLVQHSELADLSFLDNESFYMSHATSLRMGPMGYQSTAQNNLAISYNSLEDYLEGMTIALSQTHSEYQQVGLKQKSIYQQLNTAILQIENEFYGYIRPKRSLLAGERPVSALKKHGVEYVEVRCLDIDPYLPTGIDSTQIQFIDTFLIMCLLSESPPDSAEENVLINENNASVVNWGRKPDLALKNPDLIEMKTWARDLINQCKPIAEIFDANCTNPTYSESIAIQLEKLTNPDLTPSAKLLDHIKTSSKSFYELGVELAKQHKQQHQTNTVSAYSQSQLAEQAKDSLQKLKDLELVEEESFESFLFKYTAI